jgi:hypothetical protein
MSRILWLVYERVPHPDAVSYAATKEDAMLVLELLAHPYMKRLHLAEQIENYLHEQNRLGIFERKTIPCRRASGLYQLLPWRLAKWLSKVLPAGDSVIENTETRIRSWLREQENSCLLRPSA